MDPVAALITLLGDPLSVLIGLIVAGSSGGPTIRRADQAIW